MVETSREAAREVMYTEIIAAKDARIRQLEYRVAQLNDELETICKIIEKQRMPLVEFEQAMNELPVRSMRGCGPDGCD